ncbi:hypothetical protein XENORESO_014250 [Xenotaenia resolanae]|uniref:Uncharacterized protein n=1 Tax=Xenotaenia resolanae TaxID=208358 RepID=A0ABV0W2V8_9TELE
MGHALVWKQEVLRPLCSPEVGSRRDLHQSSMYYNGQEDKKVFSYKSEYLNILPAEIGLCAFLFVVRIVLVLKTVCIGSAVTMILWCQFRVVGDAFGKMCLWLSVRLT